MTAPIATTTNSPSATDPAEAQNGSFSTKYNSAPTTNPLTTAQKTGTNHKSFPRLAIVIINKQAKIVANVPKIKSKTPNAGLNKLLIKQPIINDQLNFGL